MAEVVVKITIPDYEYKEWCEYEKDGVVGVKKSLKDDLIKILRQDYVKHFEIEVSHYEY
jgi:hypothetical protein